MAAGFALAAGVNSGARAEDVTARLQACRSVADTAARAACYDRIVDDFNRAVQSAAPAARPQAVTPAAPPAPPKTAFAPAQPVTPLERFGAKDLPEKKKVPEQELPPDEITAKAARVVTDANGYMTITLDSGQVWRQTESSVLKILPGTTVKIKSGVLGVYYISLTTGNRSARVKRIQ